MPPPSSRPPAFSYQSTKRFLRLGTAPQVLHAERVSLEKLAGRFGTPLYVYSATEIRRRFEIFDQAFQSVPHTICYAVKANSNLSVLRLLGNAGSGFDVVSAGEIARVEKAAKASLKKSVFSGVGKTAEEMDYALKCGILMFNVESEPELLLLAKRAAALKRKAQVALRVNPDVYAETHPYISTGQSEHKFGVPIADALNLYRLAEQQKYLDVVGVSMHIGSQITTPEPFTRAINRLASFLSDLHDAGHRIRYVDVGGGLGIHYSGEHAPEEFEQLVADYARAVLRPLHDFRFHLLLEPGRSMVAPAGALLTRVVYIKESGSKRFVIVDAAMNDLIRPSLYSAHHEIVPVTYDATKSESTKVDVVGPVCETGDFLARDREMPQVRAGDLLAVLDAGAYGMSLASNYNSRPRLAEVMVEDAKVKVVRRRETVKELFAGER
jgi:diaminopimelate decarboxylase